MFANFIAETATGTTGDITLFGARPGHIAFSAAFADGANVAYALEDGDGIKKCGGVGTYNSGANSITRNDSWTWDGSTYDDSPSGNLTLSAQTHIVRVAPLASNVNNWENIVSADGSINTHSDVDLTGLSTADLLLYDGSNFIPATPENIVLPIIKTTWAPAVDHNIIPDATGIRNLGSTTNRWNFIYGSTGTFTTINLTYDSSTINWIGASGANKIEIASDKGTPTFQLSVEDTLTLTAIDSQLNSLVHHAFTTAEYSGLVIFDGNCDFNGSIGTSFSPKTTNTYNLGSSSFRWNTAYITNLNLTGTVSGIDLDDLGDTDIVGTPGDKTVLTWDGFSSRWTPETIITSMISNFDFGVTNNSSVVSNTAKISADGSIDTHSDVDDTGKEANTFLVYDGSNWTPFKQSYINLRNTSNTSGISTSNTVVTLNNIRGQNDASDWTLSSNELEFDNGGTYDISYDLTLEDTTNTGTEVLSWIQRWTGSTWITLSGTNRNFTLESTNKPQSASARIIFTGINSGDKLRIICKVQSGTGGGVRQTTNGTTLTAVRLNT